MAFLIGMNPRTGKQELQPVEDHSYSEQLTASTYTDMLHDKERLVQNEAYDRAIQSAIAQKGRDAVVLDIGTGTGLLAMMAARAGACNVYACEVFSPMCMVAGTCIRENGLDKSITIIPKRSTEISIGPDGDMPSRASVIIMEIFDSELIGEGVLCTMRHALANLAVSDVIIIPSEASVHVQLCWSEDLSLLHSIDGAQIGPVKLSSRPQGYRRPSPLECHIETFIPQRQSLSFPTLLKTFTFSDPKSLAAPSTVELELQLTEHAKEHNQVFVLFWWSMQLGSFTFYTYPESHWRHHWQQCVYSLARPLVITGRTLSSNLENVTRLYAHHDDYQWSFANCVEDLDAPPDPLSPVFPWHRTALLHHSDYWQSFAQELGKIQTKSSDVLQIICTGNGSILPAIITQLHKSSQIYILETGFRMNTLALIPGDLQENIKVIYASADEINLSLFGGKSVDAIVAEPFFMYAELPWEDLIIHMYDRQSLQKFLSPKAQVFPSIARIMVQLASILHFPTLRCSAGEVSGFNLSGYDRALGKPQWEPIFLPNFEYTLIGSARCALELDFNSQPTNLHGKVVFVGEDLAKANSLLAWVDCTIGSFVHSNAPGPLHTRQAVHILPAPFSLSQINSEDWPSHADEPLPPACNNSLVLSSSFNASTASISLPFAENL
eukprot:gene8531-978_t